MKSIVVQVVLALALIGVFVFPVCVIGPIDFFAGLEDWITDPDLGGQLGGYMVLIYIFALPLMGVMLLANALRRYVKLRAEQQMTPS